MTRFLNVVEWLGNLLPHPIILFIFMTLLLVLVSGVAGYFELSVTDPRPEGAKGRAPDGIITAISLMNGPGLAKIVSNLVTNFTSFAPLGTVLVALLGVGIADRSGLISAAMRGTMLSAPRQLVTAAVVFCGVMSNTAAELGYVVLIPLAAVIFHALGRHPLAGLAAAFAGVSGGYSANLLLGTVDPLLSGITQEAARLVDPDYTVGPEANWYFMFASTFLITLLGWFVTEKIIEPKLGAYNPEDATDPGELSTEMTGLTPVEKRGLWAAGISALVFFGLIMATVLRYNRHAGVGTLMALMVPYSAVFLTAWSLFFYIWVFALGLPVGPGAATYYTMGQ